MKKSNNYIFNQSKEELFNIALNTKAFRAIKYSGIVIGGIYLLGHIFKIFAFTNSNFNLLKNSIKKS